MTKHQIIQKHFNQKSKLTLKNPTYKRQVKFLTDFFLAEDLGDKGDITSDLLIKRRSPATAVVIAKEDGIIAGLEEVIWLSKTYNLKPKTYTKDGDKIKKGEKIFQLKGNIKTILKLERTILNILQRMSGIATQTNKLVKLAKNKILICPTRKTQWGLLDRKAITLGGGGTHRLGLYDWILIKDNHIQCANLQKNTKLRTTKFFEIECKTEKQFSEFIKLNPGAMMLDNMMPKNIKRILNKYYTNTNETIIEASGGINEKNIREYTKTGVDIISIGALTHSVKALDISLDLK